MDLMILFVHVHIDPLTKSEENVKIKTALSRDKVYLNQNFGGRPMYPHIKRRQKLTIGHRQLSYFLISKQ